jgi:CubicO group peptidase (beta-lactamase class C family)
LPPRGEVGAAVCVIVDGAVVVELFGGWADWSQHRPWGPDTVVNFYSVGKAFVGLLALQLVDADLVGLDDPIASVWPEFAQGGKETATVRHALCHGAGVPAIRRPLTNDDLWDWNQMTSALAETEAWWKPGTSHAYHSNTYGHLIGDAHPTSVGRDARDPVAGTGGSPRRRCLVRSPCSGGASMCRSHPGHDQPPRRYRIRLPTR